MVTKTRDELLTDLQKTEAQCGYLLQTSNPIKIITSFNNPCDKNNPSVTFNTLSNVTPILKEIFESQSDIDALAFVVATFAQRPELVQFINAEFNNKTLYAQTPVYYFTGLVLRKLADDKSIMSVSEIKDSIVQGITAAEYSPCFDLIIQLYINIFETTRTFDKGYITIDKPSWISDSFWNLLISQPVYKTVIYVNSDDPQLLYFLISNIRQLAAERARVQNMYCHSNNLIIDHLITISALVESDFKQLKEIPQTLEEIQKYFLEDTGKIFMRYEELLQQSWVTKTSLAENIPTISSLAVALASVSGDAWAENYI